MLDAAPTEKPVFLQNLGLPRGAYRRIGSTDQEGTEDDLVALYAGHQLDTFDAAVLPDADMEDIDPAALGEMVFTTLAANPDEPADVRKAGEGANKKLAKLGLVGELAPERRDHLVVGDVDAFDDAQPAVAVVLVGERA